MESLKYNSTAKQESQQSWTLSGLNRPGRLYRFPENGAAIPAPGDNTAPSGCARTKGRGRGTAPEPGCAEHGGGTSYTLRQLINKRN